MFAYSISYCVEYEKMSMKYCNGKQSKKCKFINKYFIFRYTSVTLLTLNHVKNFFWRMLHPNLVYALPATILKNTIKFRVWFFLIIILNALGTKLKSCLTEKFEVRHQKVTYLIGFRPVFFLSKLFEFLTSNLNLFRPTDFNTFCQEVHKIASVAKVFKKPTFTYICVQILFRN